LVRLLRDLGVTTLFVSHDQEEAFVVGERVAVMQSGRIVQEGEPADIYEHPISAWLAHFVGDANLIAATAHHGGAMTNIGVVPTIAPLDGNSVVLVRPEYLEIGHGQHGTVESVEFYGHDTSYVVTGIGEALRIRELRAPRFRVGDRVDVAYAGGPTVAFLES
jgi:ABC-type Fe3+/spermidine/putrescine transport system ATPase subunit